jgi:hypothetical protein
MSDHCEGLFALRPEKVLRSCIQHATSLEARASIKESGFLRGAKDPSGQYDGPMSDEDAPLSAYFVLSPQSDEIIFPWSRYPKRLPSGSEISILLYGLNTLFEDDTEVKMFHASTNLTKYGFLISAVAHTHIVIAFRKDWDWCSKRLIELDIDNNPLLWRDKSRGINNN